MTIDKKYLTVQEVAERAKVSNATIRKWADEGLLPSTRTLGGHRRFDPADLAEKLRDANQ